MMGLAPVKINLQLVDDKVKFIGQSETNPDRPITFDYVPPLGSGDGYAGIELLTMSFAGCVSTAIVGLLKRQGKKVESYKMEITGHKSETPLSLESIEFSATVSAAETTDQELAQILDLAEKISPVWMAIKGNVMVKGKINSK